MARTSQGQSPNANCGDAAADSSKALWLQRRVDVIPRVARAKRHARLVRGQRQLVQAVQVDGDAAVDAGGAGKGGVAAALDSEGAAGEARQQDGRRDLKGVRGPKDTVGLGGGLLEGPIGVLVGGVGGRVTAGDGVLVEEGERGALGTKVSGRDEIFFPSIESETHGHFAGGGSVICSGRLSRKLCLIKLHATLGQGLVDVEGSGLKGQQGGGCSGQKQQEAHIEAERVEAGSCRGGLWNHRAGTGNGPVRGGRKGGSAVLYIHSCRKRHAWAKGRLALIKAVSRRRLRCASCPTQGVRAEARPIAPLGPTRLPLREGLGVCRPCQPLYIAQSCPPGSLDSSFFLFFFAS